MTSPSVDFSVQPMKTNFNPSGPASKSTGIFGLPHTEVQSQLVLLPVPWEATTSYGGGTSKGPRAILEASRQIDLFDLELGNFYESGIFMGKIPPQIVKLNGSAKKDAQSIIKSGGVAKSPAQMKQLKRVNDASLAVNKYVYDETRRLLNLNKTVGLVGGDHSAPYGCIQAHLEKFPEMGILHIDAHADLRNAYEGFVDSHASIMFNVILKTRLKKLVQVGIRDFCEEEFQLIKHEENKIKTFFDEELAQKKHAGTPWTAVCSEIIRELPKEVYVSFDIDGLNPKLCPNTGTPVPGGLEFQEALTLIKQLVKSGKKIIGFDLNEVSPGKAGDEWDANVGARLLFKICGWTLRSQVTL